MPHLTQRLALELGDPVAVDDPTRHAHARDASHFALTPRAVVRPRTASEVARVLEACTREGIGVTFRSGGTSLGGQAVGDGVLADTRRHFRRITLLDDGRRVAAEPGATLRAVNARLAPVGRRLGPDPASEIACTIGGVVANNSSGMACGTVENTYRTLASMVVVLADGTRLDTADADADARLQALEPAIHAGLAGLRDRVRGNADSVATLERLFALKNTMGYGLNAFLDFDDPVDILQHLVIGSEGTLAFVAEARFDTLPVLPALATGLLLFADLAAATRAVPALVGAGFATIELLDAASLRVARRDPQAVPELVSLDVDRHAALLVELREPDAATLAARRASAAAVLAGLPTTNTPHLDDDPARRAALWHIRKGLYTAVAGSRPSGTTALLEDVAVPLEALAATCDAIQALVARHGYGETVIFGHAKDGNVHFMLTERFGDAENIARFQRFSDDLVELVLAAGGTLKAEHGTGRMMAPYVRRQYGDELYEVMVEVKQLLDPAGVLNPGVLLNEDADAAVAHLKAFPTVEEEVDRCVECGYCEPVCPSRDLTLTPRTRIVLRRESALATASGDAALGERLGDGARYASVDTCAVDGMCQTACPVGIDTGDLTRRLRAGSNPAPASAGWAALADHWDAVTRTAAVGLTTARRLGPVPGWVTAVGRRLAGADAVPAWTPDLPGGGRPRPEVVAAEADLVWFPSCTATMFGTPGDSVVSAFAQLLDAAGLRPRTPEGIRGLCCGTPWKSKGFRGGCERMAARTVGAVVAASEGGRLPIVVDASSCSEGLAGLLAADPRLTVVDATTYVAEAVVPGLPEVSKVPRLALHPTCSGVRSGSDAAARAIAGLLADEVFKPPSWGCCGFAGDRGMLHPELTASATAAQAAEVVAAGADLHASTNRTCELALTRATGRPYEHVLVLLADAVAHAST